MIRSKTNVAGMSWDVFVKLTCTRLSEESGEDVVHDVDVSLTFDPDDRVRYTALTAKGDRALRIAMQREVGHQD